MCNVGEKCVQSTQGLLSTVAFKLGPNQNHRVAYALEGSIPFAGACVEWLVKQLQIIPSSKSSATVADPDDNGGVYFVPAFSGLYAPYWRDDARGVIVGLTRYANRGHVVRAALEAVCFQTREVCDAMREDARLAGVNLGGMKVLKVDGGMTVNGILMQMQADVLACEVQRLTIVETTGLVRPMRPVWRQASGQVRPRSCPSGNWTRRSTQTRGPTAAIGEGTVQEVEEGEKTLNWTPEEESPSGGEPAVSEGRILRQVVHGWQSRERGRTHAGVLPDGQDEEVIRQLALNAARISEGRWTATDQRSSTRPIK